MALRRGDDRQAEARFDAAVAATPLLARPGCGEAGHILLAAHRGDAARVKTLWAEFEGGTSTACRLSHWWFILTAAETLATTGHAPEAAALHPLVMGALERGCVLRGTDLMPLAIVAAATADAAGDETQAESLWRDARALIASLPLPLHAQHTRLPNAIPSARARKGDGRM